RTRPRFAMGAPTSQYNTTGGTKDVFCDMRMAGHNTSKNSGVGTFMPKIAKNDSSIPNNSYIENPDLISFSRERFSSSTYEIGRGSPTYQVKGTAYTVGVGIQKVYSGRGPKLIKYPDIELVVQNNSGENFDGIMCIGYSTGMTYYGFKENGELPDGNRYGATEGLSVDVLGEDRGNNFWPHKKKHKFLG